MDHRRLGRTELSVSAFALGGGIVGGVLIVPPEDVRLAALNRALEAGCNWIDTAAGYGDGESERALGRLLPQTGHAPHLSTKVNVDGDRLGDLEGQIRRSLEASLTRLRRDRVDLFQLHNRVAARAQGRFLSTDTLLRPGGVADVFDKLREEGYFRFHGITALGETAALIEAVGSGRFDTAQVYYNALNPSAGRPLPPGWGGQDFAGLLAACRAQDVGVMAIRVLAAGVLATERRHGREGMLTDTTLGEEEARARQLAPVLEAGGGTRARAAVRYALANDALSTIVVGTASLEQLDEALAAFAAGPLEPAAVERIEAVHRQPR